MNLEVYGKNQWVEGLPRSETARGPYLRHMLNPLAFYF